jgi:hypothetical protein
LVEYYANPNRCKHCHKIIEVPVHGGKRRITRALEKFYCDHKCQQAYQSAEARARPKSESKICGVCDLSLPLAEFHHSSKSLDGRRSQCKKCRKSVDAGKYGRRSPNQREQYAQNERKRRDGVYALIVAYLLTHPCVDCGEADPVVLEFDHVRDQKTANIAYLAQACSIKRVMEEKKCDGRYANCHRRMTARRAGWWKIKFLAGEALNSEAPLGKREEVGAIPAAGTILCPASTDGGAAPL